MTKRLNITCYQLNGQFIKKTTLNYCFTSFYCQTESPNEPTIYQLSSNSVSLSAIIALSKSLLVVEVSWQGGGLADTDETVSAKHVSPSLLVDRDELSPPSWSFLIVAFCRRITRPPSQSEETESTRCAASFVPCVLKNFWKNKKKNNVIPTIEIMSPMKRQQKQRGPCRSNITHAAEHPRRKWHAGVDKPQASRAVRKAHRYTAKSKVKHVCLPFLGSCTPAHVWQNYKCLCKTHVTLTETKL